MSLESEQLKLVNAALVELGHSRLSSLSTSATETIELTIAENLPSWMVEVLEEAEWDCVAKQGTSLTAYTAESTNMYDYAFLLPTDFVRLIGLPTWAVWTPTNPYDQDVFMVQGLSSSQRILWSKYPSPAIWYVHLDYSTEAYYAKLDATLRKTIIKKIKKEMTYAVTNDSKKEQQSMGEYEQQLAKARSRIRKRRTGNQLVPPSDVWSNRQRYI